MHKFFYNLLSSKTNHESIKKTTLVHFLPLPIIQNCCKCVCKPGGIVCTTHKALTEINRWKIHHNDEADGWETFKLWFISSVNLPALVITVPVRKCDEILLTSHPSTKAGGISIIVHCLLSFTKRVTFFPPHLLAQPTPATTITNNLYQNIFFTSSSSFSSFRSSFL